MFFGFFKKVQTGLLGTGWFQNLISLKRVHEILCSLYQIKGMKV